jgi:ferritin
MLVVKDLLDSTAKEWLKKSLESELYASNLYRHLANNLERLGFFGAKKYYLNESADELKHSQTIVDFYNQMGTVAPMPKVDAITDKVTSIADALELQMEAEYDLLKQYEEMYNVMEKKNSIISQFILQFLEIQRLSYGEVGDLISRYNQCGNNEAAILSFDKFLGKK